MYPEDIVIIGDAHQYLLDHHQEFDFVWSSPPCPTHSKANTSLKGYGIYRYPDMSLYQEIIFLKHFFKGKWVVENVIPYYKPLIEPTATIDRHHFWSNFEIPVFTVNRKGNVARSTKETLANHHGIKLPPNVKDQRKLLRNAVYPPVGLHIINHSELDQPTSPVYKFFTAPEEVQRPIVEEAIKKASKEQAELDQPIS